MNTIDRIALLFVAGLLATMPVFALSHGRTRDADIARRGRTMLLGWWLREWFIWMIAPIERAVVHARISPDVFSWMSALSGLGAGIAFALEELSVAGWLILLGGVADNLDGRVARARGVAGVYGAFMDSTLDRFSETFAFLGIIALFAQSLLPTMVAASALAASMLVSYTRARGEALGVGNVAGVMQRAERVVVLALGALLDPLSATLIGWPKGAVLAGAVAVIAVGASGTAVFRAVTIARVLATRTAP